MADFTISKGFDIRLVGRPADALTDLLDSPTATVYPLDYTGIKQRLLVNEGDVVKRGAALVEDKRNPLFKIRAPAGGTISSVVRGDRRLVEQIVIRIDRQEGVETFKSFAPDQVAKAGRRAILDQLVTTGYLALIRQRPFSRMANAAKRPKAIFVNGMATAPFQADPGVAVRHDPAAFQAGLDLLTQLTEGAVHLCVGPKAGPELTAAQNVQVHTFRGPHPAGNSSVHISRIAPMQKGDILWTVKAADLTLIGRLFLDGTLPQASIVSLGGNGVQEGARRHYRMRIGGSYSALLRNALLPGESRVIAGDVLSGQRVASEGSLRFGQSALTVIPEGRERRFLGWLALGVDRLSFTPAYLSSWISRGQSWALNTNRNGGERAMVLTGHYDKVVPLNIMTDFLVRAVLAGDTEEAIKLGLLEVDPEDFALCDFVCPCKMEIQDIIRRGLEQVEAEGI
ncbi:MAG: Na(+)-translocating NADH-quinone reductase subunit A [Lentisphaerae bacterium]|nr:Na(+)-translocating NADH-quinone reductase subunit A [Lentisphaerota bacterium]